MDSDPARNGWQRRIARQKLHRQQLPGPVPEEPKVRAAGSYYLGYSLYIQKTTSRRWLEPAVCSLVDSLTNCIDLSVFLVRSLSDASCQRLELPIGLAPIMAEVAASTTPFAFQE